MTASTVRLSIPGVPVPKGRPRQSRGRRRPHTPAKTRQYERVVAWAAKAACPRPLEGPLEVRLLAIWPMKGRPRQRVPRPEAWKPTRPDIDNVAKAVLDGLDGIAFHDDGAVVRLIAEKVYARQGEEPRVEVVVRQLPPRGDSDEEIPHEDTPLPFPDAEAE